MMGSLLPERVNRRSRTCSSLGGVTFLSLIFFSGIAYVAFDFKGKLPPWESTHLEKSTHFVPSPETLHSDSCQSRCTPSGSEPLPKGIVSKTSNLEMQMGSLSPKIRGKAKHSRSLLALAAGIKQKEVVDQIVKKFPSSDFTVMIFHYDGVLDQWRDLEWSDTALHVSAMNQTKWWFAKRFLHPDIVAEYDYIFLWDEDLGVEHFNPVRYLSIVQREGLEISQPALDANSQVHHQITARWKKGDLHRRIHKLGGGGRCDENNSGPPCSGWVEMMAPVFSKAAWRCSWHLIQNDLIYAWGLDFKLGYCAQGDRSKNVGIVDSEYIIHKGIPSLGGKDEDKMSSGPPVSDERLWVRMRSYTELRSFKRRWQKAVYEDESWIDPYPEHAKKSNCMLGLDPSAVRSAIESDLMAWVEQ